MAAAVTLLGTATFNTTSGTKTVTATPAVGDLIVIVTAHSGNTSTAAPTDNNSSGTYTLVNTAVKATSADTMKVWVRNALITSATSTVFTHAPGTSTGGGLAVLKITGMSRTGSSAIVRSGIQSNQAAGGTPAPALGATPSSVNAIITAVFNATSPAGVTARTGYTRSVNVGYSTPTTGLAVAHDDAGETSATITWGGTSASAFASVALEIDGRVTHTNTGTLTGQIGSVVGSAQHRAKHTTTGTLTGQASSIVGSASNFTPHATSGTLTGPGAVIDGAADHEAGSVPHTSTGALTGPGSAVVGSATRFRQHPSSGTLTGPGSAIVGSADHEALEVPHVSTGALTGQGSTLSGSAARLRAHPSTGTLSGQGAVVAGSSTRLRAHASTGTLAGLGAVVVGDADHEALGTPHIATGALVGQGAEIVGYVDHDSPVGPEPERGDGVGRRWKKRELRARDEKLAEYNRDKAELRRLIERAIDPVQEGEEVAVVTTANKKAVSIVRKNAPAVAIPAIKFDARQVSVEIGRALAAANIETKRLRDVETKRMAEEAYRAAVENMRIRMKRRREEELLLLI